MSAALSLTNTRNSAVELRIGSSSPFSGFLFFIFQSFRFAALYHSVRLCHLRKHPKQPIADLFDVSKSTVSEHLTHIYAAAELDASANCSEYSEQFARRGAARSKESLNTTILKPSLQLAIASIHRGRRSSADGRRVCCVILICADMYLTESAWKMEHSLARTISSVCWRRFARSS